MPFVSHCVRYSRHTRKQRIFTRIERKLVSLVLYFVNLVYASVALSETRADLIASVPKTDTGGLVE